MDPAPEPTRAWGEPRASAEGLLAWVRSPLPERLEAAAGNAIFVHGAVVGERRPVRKLWLVACGRRVVPMAALMPSPRLAAEHPGLPGAERAIFWGVIPVAVGSAPLRLAVEAELEGGKRATIELAAIEPGTGAAPEAPAPAAASDARIAICMATHEPPPRLLARQLESLVAQTREDWICLISDDASGPRGSEALERLTAGDPRFVVSRSPRRLGAYENFCRSLAMVPRECRLVALCDQDDRWHPGKLATLASAIGDARLVFSDMRLVRPDGTVLSDTYWTARQPNHESFASLLLGNSVSGAASMFHRDLLDDALPMPPRAGNLYHDHWLALVAAATGRVAYVDRPLYDYVQHPAAVIGHAGANRGVSASTIPGRLAGLRHRPRGSLRDEWRRIYFSEYCRAALTAVALRTRFAALEPATRRAIGLLLAADRSPGGLAWLAARQARRLHRNDTGGSEAGMLRGLLWRRAVRLPVDGPPDADLPPRVASVDPTFPQAPG